MTASCWSSDGRGYNRGGFSYFGTPAAPLFPVISITSVKYTDTAGVEQTISSSNYTLKNDDLGAYVEFITTYPLPGGLYRSAHRSTSSISPAMPTLRERRKTARPGRDQAGDAAADPAVVRQSDAGHRRRRPLKRCRSPSMRCSRRSPDPVLMQRRYDRQIIIQRKTLTQSESGEPIETWADLCLQVFAFVAPTKGSEKFAEP
jgi:hypothetical protein